MNSTRSNQPSESIERESCFDVQRWQHRDELCFSMNNTVRLTHRFGIKTNLIEKRNIHTSARLARRSTGSACSSVCFFFAIASLARTKIIPKNSTTSLSLGSRFIMISDANSRPLGGSLQHCFYSDQCPGE